MAKLFLLISSIILLSSCTAYHTAKKQTPVMEMNHPEWIKNTNVYEVNLRQYTKEGTFNAFVKELPRLKEMGVQTLWMMPITPIAQKNKKGSLGSYYAAADYTSINSEFGTMDDFKNLVKTAHQQGFKVIIDWVANHTGWDHKWTITHPDYYERDSTGNFKAASGMEDIIELDFKNPALHQAMIEAMKFWINEADIDGFRCDLAFWVELDFWQEAKPQLEAVKPLFWLGELDPLEHPEYMQVFDAAYTWTWMHGAQKFYQEHLSIPYLDSILQRYVTAPGLDAWFTSNHDENSWNGTEYEKYGDMAKALAVFSCTWPGLPLIYSGQELPNLKRLQFFERDPIEWNGHYALQDFYKTLLTLHSRSAALQADAPVFRLHTSDDAHLFVYLRKNDDKEVLVVLNLSGTVKQISIEDNRLQGSFKEVFSGRTQDLNQTKNFEVEAWGYQVFEN